MARHDWYKVHEVAELLRVTPLTVRRWIKAGRLKAGKAGPRLWRVRREDLEAFAGRIKIRLDLDR